MTERETRQREAARELSLLRRRERTIAERRYRESECPTCATEPAALHAVLGHSPAPYGIGASLATAPRDAAGEVPGVLA